MSIDITSFVITAAVFVANMILLFHVFPGRYGLHVSLGIVAFFAIAELTVESLFGPLRFDYGGLRGIVYFPLLIFLLKGSIFQKLFVFFLQLVFTISLSTLVSETVGYFLSSESLAYKVILLALLIPILTIYAVLGVKYRHIIYEKLFAYGSRTEWAVYSFVGLFSFGIMAMSGKAAISTPYFIAILFFILLSFAVLCFAIINTHEKSKQQYEAEFARKVISSGREHYQKMDELHDKLRTLHHDYKYHLIAIDEYLSDVNKEELKRYLDGMKTQFTESEITHRFCGNSVINALLVRYAERCAKSKITFTTDVVLPDNLSVPNYDLCIVVGNLLENAVEACENQLDGKFIEIILRPLGEQLALRVKNSFNGRIFESESQLKSLKKYGGFGLRSIEVVAARYDGELQLDWKGDVFSAYVTMKL